MMVTKFDIRLYAIPQCDRRTDRRNQSYIWLDEVCHCPQGKRHLCYCCWLQFQFLRRVLRDTCHVPATMDAASDHSGSVTETTTAVITAMRIQRTVTTVSKSNVYYVLFSVHSCSSIERKIFLFLFSYHKNL